MTARNVIFRVILAGIIGGVAIAIFGPGRVAAAVVIVVIAVGALSSAFCPTRETPMR